MNRTILIRIALVFLGVLTAFPCAFAQSRPPQKDILRYEIDERGDTIFVDEITPARIHPKKYLNKREWRSYARRVHNFSKAYPYALFIAQTIRETDSLFAARNYSEREQDKYLASIKDELLNNFEPIFKELTLSQGMMMIRLVDREVGMPPYYIIKKYLGSVNAGFWQGVAKLFKGDIKQRYDPEGEDADLEQLCIAWHYGEYDELYMFLFGKKRPEIFIPEKFREPFYKSLEKNKDRGKAAREARKKRRQLLKESI
ncbi:MAG: DUF4294 domain-containing protein [Bacteroidales bacterium]|nr:DUF4294 domain-containing protein [Bacteroidales bacterium]